MVIMRLLGRAYDRLSDISSSILSLVFGIINVLWIYFFDRFANGKLAFADSVSVTQWVTVANITVYALIILLLLSVVFGVIGIIKDISGDKRLIIIATIGILLGILPMIVLGLSNSTWFRLLFI
jgi:hypothetical protein